MMKNPEPDVAHNAKSRGTAIKANTVILHTAALFLLPLQLLFSAFLLLRGHDEPGGGFIAGLVAAGAFVLYLFAHGVAATRALLRVDPHDILASGLLLGLLAAVIPLLLGQPMLSAQWWNIAISNDTTIKLSSVLLFDIGVYFAVLGTIMIFVVTLAEAEE
jgi:multicomponent Na+:H+ antiporter subunit B